MRADVYKRQALAVAPGKDQATFQLYSGSTAQAGNEVGTPFMIDEDGTFETSIELLEPGTYTLKELTAPEGFTLDEQLITFTVSARTITEMCIRDRVTTLPLDSRIRRSFRLTLVFIGSKKPKRQKGISRSPTPSAS